MPLKRTSFDLWRGGARCLVRSCDIPIYSHYSSATFVPCAITVDGALKGQGVVNYGQMNVFAQTR